MTTTLKVGDVIASGRFSGAHYELGSGGPEDIQRDVAYIDGETHGACPVPCYLSEDERVSLAASSGKIPPRTVDVDISAHDPTRGSAGFVIEAIDTRSQYHSTSIHITARRLRDDGSYDPTGEIITFSTHPDLGYNLCRERDLRVVRHMQVQFV